MAKPYIHAQSSARKFGGIPEDYIEIHNLLDSSKSVVADNRHRALTHNSWFLFILEKIFGITITNKDGNKVSVREIGEQHILEDFGGKFIPTPQDYISEMQFKDWMQNGNGYPPSYEKLKPSEAPTAINISLKDVIVDGCVPPSFPPFVPPPDDGPYDGPKYPINPRIID